jgi:hypothetical protein
VETTPFKSTDHKEGPQTLTEEDPNSRKYTVTQLVNEFTDFHGHKKYFAAISIRA